MRYRLYTPADFEALYALEERCFQPPLRFPRNYMRQLVTSARAAAWLAEDDSGLAGFAVVEWFNSSEGSRAYIATIEVSAEQRRRGIGTELLRRIEGSARKAGAQTIWLHVDAENGAAIRLYQAHGYEHKGREEHFYGDDRPALIFVKRLA